MPRNVDPGSIKVGKGLAPEGTVEDNSLRYPERDADPLRVHIHDPSRAHMAATIGIVDEADCYVSDEVEGALQELCASSGAGRLNGLIAGGTFVELGCAPNGGSGVYTGTTLTLCDPTDIFMNGSVFDATGLTVNIPDGNFDYYIYLDTNPPSPTYRELVALTAGPPEVETGIPDATVGPGSIEHVMLAKVTKVGTDVTAWQDARFFVRNLDRKVQYSSRQGENVDAWSEGCFANLQAFFFWAEYYGDGALASSNEEEKGTVLIRGTHIITSGTFTVPTDHLQFVGDGEAVLRWTTVGAPGDIITMVDKSDVTFRNITFIADVAGCRGIVATGNYSDITVEDCRFLSGTGSFSTAMSFTGGPANVRTLVRDCYVEATASGVTLDGMGSTSSYGAQVQDTVIQGTSLASSIGITLGTGATVTGGVHITGCMITDMEQGIHIHECGSTQISHTAIKEVTSGIVSNITTGGATGAKISDCAIVLSDGASQYGIAFFQGYKDINIKNCSIENLVAGGHALAPVGIYIRADKDSEEINAVVEGNTILGFYDNVGNVGSGIHILGHATTGYGATVTGNTLGRCGITVDAMMAVTITGNILSASGGSPLPPGPTAGALFEVRGCQDFTITGNTIDGEAAVPVGIAVAACGNFTITGNTVRRCTVDHIWGSSISTFYPGLGLLRDFTITGNTIDGILAGGTAPTARGIWLSSGADGCPREGLVDANVVRRCANGILLTGHSASILMEGITASNNLVANCAHGQDVQDPFNFAQAGTKAIGLAYTASMVISGNQITRTGVITDDAGIVIVLLNDVYPLGIYTFNTTTTSIEGNTINGTLSQGNGFSRMVLQVIGTSGAAFASEGVSLQGNTIVFNDAHNSTLGAGIVLIGQDAAFPHLFGRHSIDGNTITTVNVGFGVGIGFKFLDGTATEGLSVSRNTVEGYTDYGIRMETGSAPTLTQALVDTQIRGNHLGGQPAQGLAAISVDLVASQADFVFHDNDITGNTVSAGYGDGISLEFAAAAAGRMSLDTFSVSGNRIAHLQGSGGVATRGVVASFDGASYYTGSVLAAPGLTRFGVNDNEVRDCTEGISLIFGEVPHVEHLSINNNRITASGLPNSAVLRVSMTPLAGINSEMMFTSIHDNEVEVSSANALIGGLWLDLQNCILDALSINNNNIGTSGLTDSGEQSPAIRIFNQVAGVPASTSTVSNVLVQGNLVGGPINVRTDGNVDGKLISINNNHVSIPESNVSQDSAVLVLFDGGGSPVEVGGIQVNGNDISGGNHSISLMVDDCNLEGVTLDSNQMRDTHSTGIGISLLADQKGGTTTTRLRNISISDNQCRSTRIGVHCMSGSGGDLLSLVIARNQITLATERGIWLQAGGLQTGFEVIADETVAIDFNVLTNCAIAATSLPAIEVSRDPSAGTATYGFQGLSISGNTISPCGSVAGVTAIYADLTSWGEVRSMRVDNNLIMGSLGRIIGSGIELDLPNVTGLSVSRNEIAVWGFNATGTGNGIYLQFWGDEVKVVSIDDNAINLTNDARHGIRCREMSVIDFGILNLSISRNKVQGLPLSGIATQGGWGIRWDGEDDVDVVALWEDMVWNDNVVHDMMAGIVFTPGRDTSQDWHSHVRNCSFDGNTITDVTSEGLTYNTGDNVVFGGKASYCHGLSVSRNSVVTRHYELDKSVDHALIKVHHNINYLTGASWEPAVNLHMISINDNHCYLSSVPVSNPPAPGVPGVVDWAGLDIEFGCRGAWNAVNGYADEGNMSSISVDRNIIRNVAYSGIALHLWGNWHADAELVVVEACRVTNLSVCHNSVKRYANTATNTGSLELFLLGTVAQVFSLEGNKTYDTEDIYDAAKRAVSVQTTFGGATSWSASAPVNSRWSVQGNIVRAAHADPVLGPEVIYITGFVGGTPSGITPIPSLGIVTGNSNKTCITPFNDFANAGGFWAFGVNANNLNT